MRKEISWVLLLLILCDPVQGRVQAGGSWLIAPPKVPSFPIPWNPGERLRYSVSWANFLVAAELVLQVKGRESAQGILVDHLSVEARTVGIVDRMIYRINDRYESWISLQPGQPSRAEALQLHGRKRQESLLILDPQSRKATLGNGRVLPIPPETVDLGALTYHLRSLKWEAGKPHDLTVLDGTKLHLLRGEFESHERVTVPAGEFDTVRIALQLGENGTFDDTYKIRLNLSTDSRRLPVLLRAIPPWGEVRAELASAQQVAGP